MMTMTEEESSTFTEFTNNLQKWASIEIKPVSNRVGNKNVILD